MHHISADTDAKTMDLVAAVGRTADKKFPEVNFCLQFPTAEDPIAAAEDGGLAPRPRLPGRVLGPVGAGSRPPRVRQARGSGTGSEKGGMA